MSLENTTLEPPKNLLKIIEYAKPTASDRYTYRTAVRIVLFHPQEDTIAVQTTREGLFKLPGGGIEHDESLEQALSRELREEIGATNFLVNGKVGTIVEIKPTSVELEGTKDLYGEIQHSYCYWGKVSGSLRSLALDDQEKSFGAGLSWLTIDRALENMEHNFKSADAQIMRMISLRDSLFLEQFKSVYENLNQSQK